MRFVVPIGLRQYGDNFCIAASLSQPRISAVGLDVESTLTTLRSAIEHQFSASHPRILANFLDRKEFEIERRSESVFRASENRWVESEGTSYIEYEVEQPLDLVSRQITESLTEYWLPLYDDHVIAKTDAEGAVVKKLIEQIRQRDWDLTTHRPLPDEYTIIDLEVSFTPFDLGKVNSDETWFHEFDLRNSGADSATPTLENVAQLWDYDGAEDAERDGFFRAFERTGLANELQKLADGEAPTAVILVGPTRVGKTALVKDFVHRRALDEISRKIWFADPPRIVSTAPRGGLWQQQAQDLFAELESSDGILYIGRVLEALDAGKYDGSDYSLAQFMKPLLSDGRIRVIAEASTEEWADLEKRDVGFARTFTVIRVNDPKGTAAERVVLNAARRVGAEYDVEVEEAAVTRGWTLQKRFAVEGSPVGRTIDFLERTARRANNQYVKTLTEERLVEAFCFDTGLPPALLLDSLELRFDSVTRALRQRVVGQNAAVDRVAEVVSITKAGLYSPDRPLGSFMFVGPTGVGKTELAKSLAEFLFGSADRLVRLDMSEYSHPDAYGRLIGEGRTDGDLTAPVRREPFSLVLLDEIEKAHPSVYDLLLQVLGEARLTDAQGKVTRFQNTIVIMTSNLGVDSMRPSIGFGSEKGSEQYDAHFRREAEKFYRPEFLARVDQFIAFQPLELDSVAAIAERSLSKIESRDGFIGQDVVLQFEDGVAEYLAKSGFDPKYGARPLKREIEQRVVWPLAEALATHRPDGAATGRKVTVSLNASGDRVNVAVEMVADRGSAQETRAGLLKQVGSVSRLRRKLSSYTLSAVFGGLEWDVESFDMSSQSDQFWNDPRAAEMAANAERLRRVIDSAAEVSEELAELEDLATESFHTRAFDLASDVDERILQLESRVQTLFMATMNAAYDSPNVGEFLLYTRPGNGEFRDQLIRWYKRWADHWGWTMSLHVPLPDSESKGLVRDPHMRYDSEKKFWKTVEHKNLGAVVLIQFQGESARAIIRAENGVQRYVSPEGNAVVEVSVIEEYDGWPFPEDIDFERSRKTFTARIYNYRTREATMPRDAERVWGAPAKPSSVKLDPDDPITAMKSFVVDEAWDIALADWD